MGRVILGGMKYLGIFVAMLVLAYVFSRPVPDAGSDAKNERERAIAEHRVTQGMSVGDVLRSWGDADAKTSTPSGQIVWGYKNGQYVLMTVNGVVAVGKLEKDGQPYFTGKDAAIFRR